MQNDIKTLRQELDILKQQIKDAYIKIHFDAQSTAESFKVDSINSAASSLFNLKTGDSFKNLNGLFTSEETHGDMTSHIRQACQNGKEKHIKLIHKDTDDIYDCMISPVGKATCVLIYSKINNKAKQVNDNIITKYQRDFADQVPEIICEVDKDGRVYYANKRAIEKFGYSQEQLNQGMSIADFFPENRLKEVKNNMQRILNGEVLPTREYTMNTKTGKIHILLSTTAIKRRGNPIGIRAVMADITKRKELEASLMEREQNFRNLFNSMKSLLLIVRPDGMVLHANEQVYKQLGYEKTDIPGQDFIKMHAEYSREKIHKVLNRQPISSQSYSSTLIHVKDGSKMPVEASIFSGNWNHEAVYFVIFNDLSVIRRSEERFSSVFSNNPNMMAISTIDGFFLDINQRFTEITGLTKPEAVHRGYFELDLLDQRENITALKPQLEKKGEIKNIPVTLRNAHGLPHFCLFSAEHFSAGDQTYLLIVFSDITKEHILSQQLNLAMKAGNLAWYEFDILSGHVNASPNKAAILGYDPQEFKNAHYSKWTDLIHPDDYEHAMDAMRDCIYMNKKTYNVDYRIKGADGNYSWFFDRGVIIDHTSKGKPARMIGVVVDITERKKKEEQVQESEEKYRQVIESANDVILITRNQKILYVNNRIKQFFGYDQDDIIGKDILYFISRDEQSNVLKYHKKRMEGEKVPTIYETKINNSEGAPIEVELNNSRIEINGQPAILTFVRDLSERKASERRIRELNRDYEKTVNNASSIIWKTDYTDDGEFKNTFISDIGEKILGLPKGYLDNSSDRYLNLVHPEDKGLVINTIEEAVKQPGKPVKVEYRFINTSGIELWLSTQGSAELNPDGTKTLYGATFDISERKQYEIELDHQKEFLQKVINTIPSMLGVKDINGKYLTANKKFADFIGLSANNILGKTDEQILADPVEIEDHKIDDASALESGIPISSTKTITKDGETHYMQSTKVPLKNENNQYDKILFISHDITEQIENQKNLQQRSRELMLLTENTDLQIWYLKDPETYGLINKSHADFLNKSKEEIEYKKFQSIFNADFAANYTMNNKPCFEEKKSIHFQEWNKNGYGIERLLDIKKTPMVDASGNVEFVVCTAQDITEEYEAREELTTALNFNESLIDNSPMGIIVYDKSGQCILTNDAAVSIIGAPEKQAILNQNANDIESWKNTGMHKAFMDSLQSGVHKHITTELLSTYNKRVWLDCRFIPINYKKQNHIMLILEDITENKKHEENIRKNLEQQKLMSRVAFNLNTLRDFEQNMNSTLRLIGEYAGVSRVYIFRDNENGKLTSNVFEWCNKGIKPQAENLQNISYDEDVYPWREIITKEGKVHTDSVETLPPKIRKILEKQNIKSILALPLYIFGEYKGFIGFDENTRNKLWPAEEVEFLKIISHIIANTYERKIIGDNLRESEERFKKISSNAQDGIILINHQGKVSYWNDAAENIFGFTKEEIIGENMHKMLVSQENYKAFKKNIPAFAKTGKGNLGKNIELQAFTKDRTRIDIELSLSSLKIKGNWHALGIVRDITERKKAETQLKTLSKAVENASAMIVITDPEATIQYVNKKFTDVTGYTPDEVVGKNPNILSTKLLPDEFYQDLWETIKSGKEWQGEFINKRKNGDVYYESALISSITNRKGEILHFIGIKNDITQEKKAKEELLKAKQEAEMANKAKSEFLANMSHEIRTPMNAVIGFSDILSQNLKDSKNLSYISSIKSSSKTLLNLINDILDLSKIEAGQMKVEPEPTNLKNLIDEIIQIFSLKIQQKGLEIIVDIDPDIPEYLSLDELRARQIFLNVFGNAVKFTEKGYIKVILERISHTSDKIDIVCHIEDSGIGISPENQKEIFEAFKQQSSQSNRKYGGTGLGLSITKRLLEIQGGEIKLQSEPGKGSCFSLYLYQIEVAEQVDGQTTDITETTNEYHFSNEIVLIVDDVPSNRYLLSSYISEMALEIMEADNGQEAIEYAQKYKPAIIFMDLRMPKLNGIEATRLIKSNPQTSNIPVIAVTASSMHFEDSDIQQAGFDGFLDKPVSQDEITRQLVKYIKPIRKTITNPSESKPGQSQKPKNENLKGFSEAFADLIISTEASGSMSAISDLGNKILKFGEEKDDPYFMRTGDQLEQAAMGFDIEHINKLFSELKQLVNQKGD
jgi:PAS domain S-box-containing protein